MGRGLYWVLVEGPIELIFPCRVAVCAGAPRRVASLKPQMCFQISFYSLSSAVFLTCLGMTFASPREINIGMVLSKVRMLIRHDFANVSSSSREDLYSTRN